MIWIDVTDLLEWSGHMTGIQRVVFNIASRYQRDNAEVRFFYYEHNSRLFYEVTIDLSEWLKARTTEPTSARHDFKQQIKRLIPVKVRHYTPVILKNAIKKSVRYSLNKQRLFSAKVGKRSAVSPPLIFNNNDQIPLQALHHYYEPVRQHAPRRYSTPHSFCCLVLFLLPPTNCGRRYRGLPSHVPCSSRRPGSRRLHAGHHLASRRVSARLFPGPKRRPGFDVTYILFRHVISDSLAFAFLIPT